MNHTIVSSFRVYLYSAFGKLSGAFSRSVFPWGWLKWLSLISIGSLVKIFTSGIPPFGYKNTRKTDLNLTILMAFLMDVNNKVHI